MDGVGGGGDAEEGGGRIEGHAEDAGGHGAPPELVEFAGGGEGEDADDGALVGGGGEEGAGVVDRDAGEGGAVRFDDVDGFEFESVEEEDRAAGGGNVLGAWWGVRGWGEGGGSGFLRERVGEIAALGGRGKGADGWKKSA